MTIQSSVALKDLPERIKWYVLGVQVQAHREALIIPVYAYFALSIIMIRRSIDSYNYIWILNQLANNSRYFQCIALMEQRIHICVFRSELRLHRRRKYHRVPTSEYLYLVIQELEPAALAETKKQTTKKNRRDEYLLWGDDTSTRMLGHVGARLRPSRKLG